MESRTGVKRYFSAASFADGNKKEFNSMANRLLSQVNSFEQVRGGGSAWKGAHGVPKWTSFNRLQGTHGDSACEQNDTFTHTDDWKHYLPTTSLAVIMLKPAILYLSGTDNNCVAMSSRRANGTDEEKPVNLFRKDCSEAAFPICFKHLGKFWHTLK